MDLMLNQIERETSHYSIEARYLALVSLHSVLKENRIIPKATLLLSIRFERQRDQCTVIGLQRSRTVLCGHKHDRNLLWNSSETKP